MPTGIFHPLCMWPDAITQVKKRQEINPLNDLIISHSDPFALEGGVRGCTIGKNIVSIPSRVGVP